ncbi:MAG: transcriptional regulator NrdR [Planctomycetota bacterium]
MRCPFCQTIDDRVVDTRNHDEGFMIRRKRLCMSCKRKFFTVETIERQSLRVVKSDQSREPLDHEKLRRGIERACSKRNVPSGRIERTLQEIEHEIFALFEDEVCSNEIGEVVMKHLAELDEVAYIRFASVYKKFDNAADFIQTIQHIQTDPAAADPTRQQRDPP